MTGAAEDERKVRPDPLRPQLANGDFEEVAKDKSGKDELTGWHYQRQLTLKSDATAPEGSRYASFHNEDPGRGCHALQGFAVDGRQVSVLELKYWVRGDNIRAGGGVDERPRIVVTFYDERRGVVAEESVGSPTGTFDWREESGRIRVPLRAREAILRVGLLGATGDLAIDDIRLQVGTAK
jgi:protein-L-isoaspartate(D-aspartate) O-methyltransferase